MSHNSSTHHLKTLGRGACGVPQGQHVRSMLQPAAAAKPDIVDEVERKLQQTRTLSVLGWEREGRQKAAEIVTLCRRDVSDADLVAAMRAELVEQEERHGSQLGAIRALVERLQTERLASTRENTCAEIFGLLE